MSRRVDSSNPKTIKRFLAEGRGRGRWKNYKPWIYPYEISSLGKSHRLMGWKTGRPHFFLSDVERDYFYMAEWSEQIVDIREQFPLPVQETLTIAERLGVRHPRNRTFDRPYYMTSDFVLTLADGSLKARSIKRSGDLSKRTVWEKFEIERLYWASRQVDYDMVSEVQLCAPLCKNVRWLHKFRDLTDYDFDEKTAVRLGDHLKPLLSADVPLNLLALDADYELGFRGGTCLAAVKYLIATRQWRVDMTTLIDPSLPLKLLTTDQVTVDQPTTRVRRLPSDSLHTLA